MANAGNLAIVLVADSSKLAGQLSAGIKQAGASASVSAVAIGSVIGIGITKGLSVAIGAITKTISALPNAFRDGVAEIEKFRDAAITIGASSAGMAQLGFAANQSGTDFETLSKGMERLQANLVDVARGGAGPAAEALKMLGLQAGELRKLTPEKQITAIADAFVKLEDSGARVFAAKGLFGKGGGGLIQFLLQGGKGVEDAREISRLFGFNWMDSQADSVDAFGDALAQVSYLFKGIEATLAVGLGPSLKVLVDYGVQLLASFNGIPALMDMWKASLTSPQAIIGLIIDGVERLKTLPAQLQVIGAEGNLIFVKMKAAVGEVTSALETGIKTKLGEVALKITEVTGGFNLWEKGLKLVVVQAANVQRIFDALAVGIKNAIDFLTSPALARAAVQMNLPGARALASIASGDAGSKPDANAALPTDFVGPPPPSDLPPFGPEDGTFVGQQNPLLPPITNQADEAVQKLNEVAQAEGELTVAKKLASEADRVSAESSKQWHNQLAQAEVDAKTKVQDLQKTLVNVSEGSGISEGRAVPIQVMKGIKVAATEAETALQEMQQTNRSAVTDLVTAWATGTGKMSSIISNWAHQTIAQFAQFALFGGRGGGGGLIGGLVGGIANSLGGSTIGSAISTGIGAIFGAGKAAGGPVNAGTIYPVGEKGPELFMPGQSGSIIPNHKLGVGMAQSRERGATINQIFHISPGVSRAELASAMDDMSRAAASAVAATMGKGGSVRRQIHS